MSYNGKAITVGCSHARLVLGAATKKYFFFNYAEFFPVTLGCEWKCQEKISGPQNLSFKSLIWNLKLNDLFHIKIKRLKSWKKIEAAFEVFFDAAILREIKISNQVLKKLKAVMPGSLKSKQTINSVFPQN